MFASPRLRACVRSAAVLGAALFAACHVPGPSTGLRFSAADPGSFAALSDGRFRQELGGLTAVVDLGQRQTRLELTVENPGQREQVLKVGADAASATAAIGEVWRRPLGAGAGEGVQEAMPYRAGDPVELPAGWRAVFFVDSPLGREPSLGQQLTFTVEVRDPQSGVHHHATLPLVATNVPPGQGH